MSCFRLDHHPIVTVSSSPARGSEILGGDNEILEVLLQQSMNGIERVVLLPWGR